MEYAEIINTQEFGKNYAHDNQAFFFEEGMTEDEFAEAALENYNSNAEALNQPGVEQEKEVAFKFGAKQAFPPHEN